MKNAGKNQHVPMKSPLDNTWIICSENNDIVYLTMKRTVASEILSKMRKSYNVERMCVDRVQKERRGLVWGNKRESKITVRTQTTGEKDKKEQNRRRDKNTRLKYAESITCQSNLLNRKMDKDQKEVLRIPRTQEEKERKKK